MRITHVNFARGFRGGERQTLNLIEGLAGLDYEQTLVCRRGSALQERAQNLGLRTIALPHPLFGHFKTPPTDLIHVHEARGAYWAGIQNLVRNTPYIITRRIPNPISNSSLTRTVYRRAAGLFGVSQDVSQRLAQQTGQAVRTILSSTSALECNAGKTAEIRARLGNGPLIGHVGALHDHHKGQSVLIRAFQRLQRDYPRARLVLVGDGPDRARFEAMSAGDPRIVFTGFQRDVGTWLAALDIFAFPSREEGLGSVVLDAMAFGLPVAAASVGGLPELVGANERGLTVNGHDAADWEDTLRQLLADAGLRSRLTEAARDFAAQNGIAAMTQHYRTQYDLVLRHRADSRATSAQGKSDVGKAAWRLFR